MVEYGHSCHKPLLSSLTHHWPSLLARWLYIQDVLFGQDAMKVMNFSADYECKGCLDSRLVSVLTKLGSLTSISAKVRYPLEQHHVMCPPATLFSLQFFNVGPRMTALMLTKLMNGCRDYDARTLISSLQGNCFPRHSRTTFAPIHRTPAIFHGLMTIQEAGVGFSLTSPLKHGKPSTTCSPINKHSQIPNQIV